MFSTLWAEGPVSLLYCSTSCHWTPWRLQWSAWLGKRQWAYVGQNWRSTVIRGSKNCWRIWGKHYSFTDECMLFNKNLHLSCLFAFFPCDPVGSPQQCEIPKYGVGSSATLNTCQSRSWVFPGPEVLSTCFGVPANISDERLHLVNLFKATKHGICFLLRNLFSRSHLGFSIKHFVHHRVMGWINMNCVWCQHTKPIGSRMLYTHWVVLLLYWCMYQQCARA